MKYCVLTGLKNRIKLGYSFTLPKYIFHLHFQMRVRKIAPKILQLLTEWTETFPYDFRDERMMRSLKELTHRLASGDEVSPFCLSSYSTHHNTQQKGFSRLFK